MFTPYLIKDTEVVDKDGKKQTLKIGYIGVVPPQIMGWDKANLSGKVTVNDITETGNDSNLLIVFYVQIMPDDFVMQLHRF